MKINWQKKTYSALLILLFPLLTLAAVPLDRVVAIVNDQVITQSQLDSAVTMFSKQLQSAHMPVPSQSDMQRKVLDQLILKDIQLQLAKRNNIKVTDAQVNEAVSKIAAQNNLSVAQLQQALARDGISYADFQKQLREQIIISQLQQKAVGGNINVSDQEARAYLNSAPKQASGASAYRVQDIVVPLTGSASPAEITAAQQRAESILTQMRSGKANLSGQSGIQNNDLGWRKLSDLPDIFAQQVQKMQVGGITGPIRAPNGFHILKLVDLQGTNQPMNLQTAKEMIFQRKFQDQLQIWLQQLRNSAYVKIML